MMSAAGTAGPPAVAPAVRQPGIVVASGPGAATVQVLSADGAVRMSFAPYGAGMVSGVHVATGDVTGDGMADIITTPAVGAPHVKVFDGATGELVRSFYAFDPTFLGGLSVAGGDVNGDGLADLLVAEPDSGQLSVFLQQKDGTLAPAKKFPTLTGVTELAVADWDGDGAIERCAQLRLRHGGRHSRGGGDPFMDEAVGRRISAGPQCRRTPGVCCAPPFHQRTVVRAQRRQQALFEPDGVQRVG